MRFDAQQRGPYPHTYFFFLFYSFHIICVCCSFFLSVDPAVDPLYFLFYFIEKENEATVSLVSWCGGGISSFTAVGSALFLSPLFFEIKMKRDETARKGSPRCFYCWCMYINDVAHFRPCGFGHPSPRPPNGFTFQNNCFPPTLYVSLSHS